jgi:branched-chain amino acid transport system permease protein
MADAQGTGAEGLRAQVDAGERARRGGQNLLAGLFVALALIFALVAGASGDTFFFRLATEALILGGLAMAVDVLLGYTGLLSLGHALFFGFGAYASALVLKNLSPSFWAATGITLAAATLLGLVAGFVSIRARGVYFALITFGLAQVVFKAVYNTREVGGSDGIIGVPQIRIEFGLFAVDAQSPAGFFLLTLAVVMLLHAALAYLMRTPFGRVLIAIRNNESRVPFLGYSPWRAKLFAFVVAADVAALAGSLYPMLRGFVSPELFAFQASGNAVIMVILGGAGTLTGALYGAAILTALKSVIGSGTEHHLIIIGALFMLAVIFLPRGLAGYAQPRLQAWLARRGGGR